MLTRDLGTIAEPSANDVRRRLSLVVQDGIQHPRTRAIKPVTVTSKTGRIARSPHGIGGEVCGIPPFSFAIKGDFMPFDLVKKPLAAETEQPGRVLLIGVASFQSRDDHS